MVTYKEGNIFDSSCDILTCPVNCVGTLGKGLALEFKQRISGADRAYQSALRTGRLYIGHPYITPYQLDGKFICFFPTKWHWREPSESRWIWTGFSRVSRIIGARGWSDMSIAYPKLGCGLGGLSWEDEVKPLFEDYYGEGNSTIEVYI